MKKYLITILMALTLTLWTSSAFSQSVPPPPSSHGATDDQNPGNSAPIGGGLFILLGLGAAYGGKKLYDNRKEALEE